MSVTEEDIVPIKNILNDDADLQRLGNNALLVYALSLYLGIESISEFSANSLTDGGNDKKLDLCFVDEEDGLVIIAQGYFAQAWGRPAAPANKASDLNTAVAWLLSATQDRVPAGIRSKADEIRNLIANRELKRVEVIFVHNCYESANIENELKAVADATRDIIKSMGYSSADQITVAYRELGLSEIVELYRSRDSDILVDDWLAVPAEGFIEQSGVGWKALVTSVPGAWIRELYARHKDRLFSANFRDYLGTVNRKDNINYQIKQTVASEPRNFWAYNNGITALTHELRVDSDGIKIRGISIINGAQTSGAIGESTADSTIELRVLLRLVEAQEKSLISKVILFNNTQNEIKPSDRRSNHPVQLRIRDALGNYGINYSHRRSASRIPRGSISVTSIATALCAFHGDPQTAFRNSKEIFGSDEKFDSVFRPNITPEHIFLVYALSASIDEIKATLKEKIAQDTATQLQRQQYEILKFSASKHFVLYLVGRVAEPLMNRRISDLYEWKCKSANVSQNATRVFRAWEYALEALLPQVASIVAKSGDAYDVQRSIEKSRDVASQLEANITSFESTFATKFAELRAISLV